MHKTVRHFGEANPFQRGFFFFSENLRIDENLRTTM